MCRDDAKQSGHPYVWARNMCAKSLVLCFRAPKPYFPYFGHLLILLKYKAGFSELFLCYILKSSLYIVRKITIFFIQLKSAMQQSTYMCTTLVEISVHESDKLSCQRWHHVVLRSEENKYWGERKSSGGM
jgi:hypothetical protein